MSFKARLCAQDLSKDQGLYDKLTKSIAPSIWQMDDVKRGILCQLFGARSKVCSAPVATRGTITLSRVLNCTCFCML